MVMNTKALFIVCLCVCVCEYEYCYYQSPDLQLHLEFFHAKIVQENFMDYQCHEIILTMKNKAHKILIIIYIRMYINLL